MDLLALLAAAHHAFSVRLHALRPEQLQNATPCEGWDVERLVSHVASSEQWVADLVEGRPPSDGEETGLTALMAQFDGAVARTQRAFAKDPDRMVVHPYGPMPARRLVFFRCLDNLIHAWDLARATGQQEELDAEAVAACRVILEPVALLLPSTGMYATPVELDESAGPQAQLLALVGRRTGTPHRR